MSEEMTKTDGENTNEGLSNTSASESVNSEQSVPSIETKQPVDNQQEEKEAPVSYEFKAPDGSFVHPDVTARYESLAKEYGLSKEAAEGIYSETAKLVSELETKARAELSQRWRNESINDPEFGGKNLEANLAYAKDALNKYFSSTFIEMLGESGLDNHPELIRGLIAIGKDIGEDRLPGSVATPATKAKTPESILYDGK